jgi:hypothetical protein
VQSGWDYSDLTQWYNWWHYWHYGADDHSYQNCGYYGTDNGQTSETLHWCNGYNCW